MLKRLENILKHKFQRDNIKYETFYYFNIWQHSRSSVNDKNLTISTTKIITKCENVIKKFSVTNKIPREDKLVQITN